MKTKRVYNVYTLGVTKTCYSLQKMLNNRRWVDMFYYNDDALTVI